MARSRARRPRAAAVPGHARRSRPRAGLEGVREEPDHLLGRRLAAPVLHPAHADAVELDRAQPGALPLGPVERHVQHDVVVLDEHELAVLRRRDDDDLLQPDGRAGGSELPLGRGRDRGRRGADPGDHRAQRQEPGQLLAGPDPDGLVRPAADFDRGRAGARIPGCDPELLRVHHRAHDHRPHTDARDGSGRVSGGDQGARDQRRRLLQRQLGAPVRESDWLYEPGRDARGFDHPRGAGVHVRPDGRKPPPGLRDLLGDDGHVPRRGDRRVHRRGARFARPARRRAAHGRRSTGPRAATSRARSSGSGSPAQPCSTSSRPSPRAGPSTARSSPSPGSVARSRSPICLPAR